MHRILANVKLGAKRILIFEKRSQKRRERGTWDYSTDQSSVTHLVKWYVYKCALIENTASHEL